MKCSFCLRGAETHKLGRLIMHPTNDVGICSACLLLSIGVILDSLVEGDATSVVRGSFEVLTDPSELEKFNASRISQEYKEPK